MRLVSQAAGYHKPDQRIFEAALTQPDTMPSAAVFVGDNPAVDITGAKRAGLHAIWKRDPFWPQPANADLIIDEVCELREIDLFRAFEQCVQPD